MRIDLGNRYFINVDEYNWTLKRTVTAEARTDEKTGKYIEEHDYDATIGYYPNFEQCVQKLLKVAQNDREDTFTVNLEEYVAIVNKSNEDCLKAFKEVYDKWGSEL